MKQSHVAHKFVLFGAWFDKLTMTSVVKLSAGLVILRPGLVILSPGLVIVSPGLVIVSAGLVILSLSKGKQHRCKAAEVLRRLQ